jgi:hypothetical protein
VRSLAFDTRAAQSGRLGSSQSTTPVSVCEALSTFCICHLRNLVAIRLSSHSASNGGWKISLQLHSDLFSLQVRSVWPREVFTPWIRLFVIVALSVDVKRACAVAVGAEDECGNDACFEDDSSMGDTNVGRYFGDGGEATASFCHCGDSGRMALRCCLRVHRYRSRVSV